MTAVSALILIVALAGVLLRPRDVHESTFAAVGAIAMLVDDGRAARRGVARPPLEPQRARVPRRRARAGGRGGRGSLVRAKARKSRRPGVARVTIRRYAGVCIVSFAGSVLFSLDAAAVALTPVVLIAARRAGAAAEPLLFACIAVANTASMALPISNPTNVIVADRVGLDFVEYARTMLPPAIVASIAVSLVLGLRFRRELGGRLEEPMSSPGITDRAIAITSALATSVALVARASSRATWAPSP